MPSQIPWGSCEFTETLWAPTFYKGVLYQEDELTIGEKKFIQDPGVEVTGSGKVTFPPGK